MNERVKGKTSPALAKPTRRERARQTRRRILEAARAEFVANGYHGARMAAVAERAHVSVQMVYLAFGTKAKLMAALVGESVVGEEGVPPTDTAWFAALAEESTASQVIRGFVLGSGPIFERAGPLLLSQRAGATTDPELAVETAAGELLRAQAYRQVVELALTKGLLKPALDVDAAADILTALFSPALYVELVSERGWSHERAITWLAETLPTLLCGDA